MGSLAADLLVAGKFDSKEFYRPTESKINRTICARCKSNPRTSSSCYCLKCNSIRRKDYRDRIASGAKVRKYNKKGMGK